MFNMFSGFMRPETLDTINGNGKIKNVYLDEFNYALGLPFTPWIDPPLPEGWISTIDSRKVIGADIAEDEGFTGQGKTVAVIDTGVRIDHPQVQFGAQEYNAQLEAAMSPANLLRLPMFPTPALDDNGHGTHCLTTIGGKEAYSTLGYPVKGVAPRANMIAIKALGYGIGSGLTSDVIKGMEIALEKNVDVISMSLGSEGGDNTFPTAKIVNEHPEKIWVIAAGNSGPNSKTVCTPGCAREAITVGAYSIRDKVPSYFSSRGPTNDG